MAKVYEYGGKKYCEIDFSLKDDTYGGDLYDLYFELRKEGVLCESTVYYSAYNPEEVYDTAEELVKNECEDMVIGEESEE